MRVFGLIGYPLGHSFSKKYFTEKFLNEGIIDARYELFPLSDLELLHGLLASEPDLHGLNVTIPYKQDIMSWLNDLDPTAAAAGAVNTIRIHDGKLKGYNTDVVGFGQSLHGWFLEPKVSMPVEALVLGSGGASRAVCYVLEKMSLPFRVVTRRPKQPGHLGWDDLWRHEPAPGPVLWVNTTPLGMAPDVESCPPVPFHKFKSEDLVYDLVYNPAETLLLQRAGKLGCAVKNGLEMLHLQAEAAWRIWNT
ncbi:MAG: shikimate dehydrogenase [Saprospiraceae bacterium]|nr:shikimate dehydrogenase [Saprospiraceae bacterium]